MRQCTKCKELKKEEDFYGNNSWCKKCDNGRKRDRNRKEYMRRYYEQRIKSKV